MSARDIPRDRWREELDSFSRQYEGWIVRVDVTEGGATRTEARDVPLYGVSVDSPRFDAIAVIVGHEPANHVTHEVARPVAVSIEQTDAGAERALRIRSDDGSTTTVEFRSPMRPEEVDGMPR